MTNIQSAASLQKTVFGENLTREHTTGYLNFQSSDCQRGALHDSIFDDNPEYIRQWLQELEKENRVMLHDKIQWFMTMVSLICSFNTTTFTL